MEKHQLYGSRWVNVLGGEGNSIERIKVKLFSFFWVHLTLRVCIPLWFIGIDLRLLLLRWPGLRICYLKFHLFSLEWAVLESLWVVLVQKQHCML